MAKYLAPANFGGLTHNGKTFTADKKGFVELPEDFSTSVAASHGLKAPDAAAVAQDTDTAVN